MVKRQREIVTGASRLKIGNAMVCVECETLYTGRHGCPACGSKAGAPLSNWLPSMEAMQKVTRPNRFVQEVA